jgi:predicted AlkP superfamily pyrophosphatase or phosphodiesterase
MWLRTAMVAVEFAVLATAGYSQTHVILFGVDGLSAESIAKTDTPNIHTLMKTGSWSMHARAVLPTVSSPNWAAMIMGAPTEMTGVTSNDWQPNDYNISPTCQDSPGIFPTIYSLEHQQHPKANIGIFTDWPDYVRLVEPGIGAEIYKSDEKEDEALNHALDYLRRVQPDFLFIHVDHVDDAGHTYGWGTPQYLDAVKKTDRMLGQILSVLSALHLRDSTVILLTADHGGIEKKHGGMTMNEIEIPWLINGPGIRRDHEIGDNIMQYDTAATLAVLLHLQASPCWRGRPVTSAFVSK